MKKAEHFDLDAGLARATSKKYAAVSAWRQLATGPDVRLRPVELSAFASAFEHDEMQTAAALLNHA